MLVKIDRWTRWEELPEFLSPAELQAYLGLGRTTVYDLLNAGAIRHVRLGRRILIPKVAVPRGSGEPS